VVYSYTLNLLQSTFSLVLSNLVDLVGEAKELLVLRQKTYNQANAFFGNIGISLAPATLVALTTAYSQCALWQGDTKRAIEAAKEALLEGDCRRIPGIHKYLAEAYEADGDLEAARTTMQRALFYEEPWNSGCKADNLKFIARLSPEAVELRKKEAAFLAILDRLLHVLKLSAGSEGESWASIKTLQYENMTIDEDEDSQHSRRITAAKLEAASANALSSVENGSEGDDMDIGVDNAASGEKLFEELEEVEFTPSNFDNIKVTKEVIKWVTQGDPKFRDIFIRKIKELAAGERSKTKAKRLMGCKKTIFETYLEQKSGSRILWTEQGAEVLIWYVARHKEVSRLIGMIDKSEGRRVTSAASLSQHQYSHPNQCSIITPLKLYYVDDIDKFKSPSWRPPLHLTVQVRL
jgi:hypothetical protein